MSTLDDEVKFEGVYGTFQTGTDNVNNASTTTGATGTDNNLPVTRGFWSSMKAFWLQKVDLNQKIDWKREIKVELTPNQQKVENELNDFLHQEITWEKFRNFLTHPISSGK